jgi:hypothetical protein
MAPLVIAAHPLETKPLAADFECFHFGVGAILAAQNSAALASRVKGRDVIYVGTGGIFGSFCEPELFQPIRVHWSDSGLRLKCSYAIKGDLEPVDLPKEPAAALPVCEVVCSATISLMPEPPLVPQPKKDFILENIELYSIAKPLIEAAQSVKFIIASTNAVGSNAHQDWQKYANRAAELTAQFVKTNIVRRS